MRFKGERVFVRADESGKPALDEAGRAEMKYRESDNKSYRPFAGNLLPDEDGGGAATRTPAPSPVRAYAKAKVASGEPAVELWTDGACSGNPGPMGIGIVAIDGGKRKEVGAYLGIGTNNIAELTAIDRALDVIGDDARTRRVRVYTDSAYSIGVLSKGWKAKANQELIARMRKRLAGLPSVEFVKVSGHAGVPENERCDELARNAITGR
ncbi:MAG TPA: ribonuclease H [Polyangia bacterium]|jgi:ribonuclease HI